MSEWMLRDLAAASALRYVALATSTSPAATRRADRPHGAECDVAGQGRVPAGGGCTPVDIDFRHRLSDAGRHGRTRYIHVEDLAAAHLKALDYLRAGGDSTTLKLRLRPRLQRPDVLQMVERINDGQPLSVVLGRAALAIHLRLWRMLNGSARCSAGSRSSTISR